MKLYLSSYKFGNFTNELVKLIGDNKRVAIIMNALDYGDPVRVQKSLEDQISTFKSMGLEAEGLDLRNYFSDNSNLESKIQEYGSVWVCGGNSYVLQRAFTQSRFASIIKELVENEEIVYAGYSAGVVVITPTLSGIELVDDPNIVPENYNNECSLDGLGLIKYVVAVHYKSDHPESAQVDKYVEFCEKENIPYKTLRDGEVIVVDGNREEVFYINN